MITKVFIASELQVFVLVRVAVNAPLVRVKLVRITIRTGTSTGTVVSVNAALGYTD